MADWHTPIQVQTALETMWMKLEKTNTPLKEIREEDAINYYNKKRNIDQRLQYDLFFNTNKSYDPKVKTDGSKSQKEIHDSIYAEEMQRPVPIVTSHLYGHSRTDLEGRPLYSHKKAENKSDYRRTGLPFDRSVGLPKNDNKQLMSD